LGLMLEEVHFDRYNRKYGGDGSHEPIEWQAQNKLIELFKEEHIYPVVVQTEIKEKSLLNWMKTLALHTYGETDDDPELKLHQRIAREIDSKALDVSGEDNTDDHDVKRQKLDNIETSERQCV